MKCDAKNCKEEGKWGTIGFTALWIRHVLKMPLDDRLVLCDGHVDKAVALFGMSEKIRLETLNNLG